MLQYICDEQPEVRQAAAYGAGVMGQFGGQPYTQACGRKYIAWETVWAYIIWHFTSW